MGAAFRRARWARVVADPALLAEIEAEHAALSDDEQVEATTHVDEVSDDDLLTELGDRLILAAPADETPPKRGRSREVPAQPGETQERQ